MLMGLFLTASYGLAKRELLQDLQTEQCLTSLYKICMVICTTKQRICRHSERYKASITGQYVVWAKERVNRTFTVHPAVFDN